MNRSKKEEHMKKGIVCCLLWMFLATTGIAQQLETYEWPTAPGEAFLSDKYAVTLQAGGKTVTSQVILSKSKDLDIPDYVQEFRGGRTFNWTMFSYDFSEPVTVTVEKLFGTGASEVEIVPSPFKVASSLSDDNKKVTFTLGSSKYVAVNFKSADNKHTSDGVVKHMLMIFADTLETDVPKKTDPGVHVYSKNSTVSQLTSATTIFFPKGFHNIKDQFPNNVSNMGPVITNGKRIYFEGGSYVLGRFAGASASNAKIFGRGVLSGRDFKWERRLPQNGGILGVDSYDPAEAHISIGGSNGGYNTVDGILVCDGAGHGINLGHHATYTRTKYWGWHPNNDGFRPWGTDNKIDRCFVRACDDIVYNKGLTVTNNVFWHSYNGSVICLGWDGPYDTENTTMTDNYIIYPEWRNIGNNNGLIMSQIDYDMSGVNVAIKNLYVDGNIPAFVNLHTNTGKSGANNYTLPQDYSKKVGKVDNISLENVYVSGSQVLFDGNSFTQTARPVKSLIQGAKLTSGDIYYIQNVRFKNVFLGSECMDNTVKDKYFTIDAGTTRGITFAGCEPCQNVRATPVYQTASLLPISETRVLAARNQSLTLGIHEATDQWRLTWLTPSGQIFSGSTTGLRIDRLGADATGKYAVSYLTPEGCRGNMEFTVSAFDLATSTRNRSVKPAPVLFPNPANNDVHIQDGTTLTRFRVFNQLMQEVHRGMGQTISLHGLSSGLYYVQVDDLGIQKVVKK